MLVSHDFFVLQMICLLFTILHELVDLPRKKKMLKMGAYFDATVIQFNLLLAIYQTKYHHNVNGQCK